jgi:dipeptidyl aminopeptidase/acylaminoacyl peptidase
VGTFKLYFGAWLWVGFFGLALASGQARAQTAAAPHLVRAEEFFREPDVVEAVLSPSGQRLAITSGRGGAREGLFVIDLTKPSKPKAVAQYDDADIGSVQWVNDDLLIFSVTDFSRGSGRGDGAPGLFSVGAESARVRMLVNRKREFLVEGGSTSRALDWNHWLLSVPRPRPGVSNEEVLIGKLNLDKEFSVTSVEPIWLNVRTGVSRSTDFAPPPDAVHWLFDSKGEPRVVYTEKGAQGAAYWRAPGRSDWQLIVKGNLLEMPFKPHSVDDAGNLYVLRNEGPEGLQVLTRYDFARQQPSAAPLISTPGFDFEGELITGPAATGTGAGAVAVAGVRGVRGVRVHADAEATVWFDEGLKRLQGIVDQRFPGRVNRVTCALCGQAEQVALVRSYSDTEPGQLWVYRGKPAEGQPPWQAVARMLPGIDARHMAAVDFQRIKARDGRDVPVWLTLPKGLVPGKPAPAVVLVHGGPWVRTGYWKWDPLNQFLASRGYLVIEPEFRGSSGYGEAHYRAGWKQWGQAM